MEKRDLYDINRNLTGETIFKDEPIPPNRRILVVLSFIQNSKGELLVQKRTPQKDGTFAFTGGHPKSGETSVQGMITEISEEIGLTVSEDELKLIYTDMDDEVFFDLYYLKKDFDISSLTVQEEEVSYIQWNTIDEINLMEKQGIFKKEHFEAFERFLKILDKGEI